MYGMDEFIEQVDFSNYKNARLMFLNGYLPFAIKNVSEVKKLLKHKLANNKEPEFVRDCEGLYLLLSRYLLENFEELPIKLNLRAPMKQIPEFMFNGGSSLPPLEDMVKTFKSKLELECDDEALEKTNELRWMFKKNGWIIDNFVKFSYRKKLYELKDKGIIKRYSEETQPSKCATFVISYWFYQPKLETNGKKISTPNVPEEIYGDEELNKEWKRIHAQRINSTPFPVSS